MTAFISRLPDGIRHLLWMMWFPFVFVDLWCEMGYSPRFWDIVWACWDLGWEGIK